MYKVCLVDDEKLELNLLKNYVNWKKLGVDGIFTASRLWRWYVCRIRILFLRIYGCP